jgi:thiol-disulfide isomerase/thioredoxin
MKRSLSILITLVACLIAPAAHAKRAPNLQLKDLAGNTHKLAELRGSIVVFNFWATWCGPCREELPMLSRLNQEYSAKKVRFIAASADKPGDRRKIDEYLKQNNPAFDVWLGADLDMLESAGLGQVLPGTLILDEQGEVVARIMGQAREEDIKAPLDWLLGGKAGPPPPALVRHDESVAPH